MKPALNRKWLITWEIIGVFIILGLLYVLFAWPAPQPPSHSEPPAQPLPGDYPATPTTIASELQDCLPKSDMASKTKCEKLLQSITTFEACAAAGLPIMESYPERCTTPDGRTFTRDIEP